MRHILRRPFSKAHWSLFATAMVAWELALWAQPCKEPPHYLEMCLATTTCCVALWANHIRLAPLSGLRGLAFLLGGVAYDLAVLTLSVVVVALPIALVVPTYQCYTPRAKVSELALASTALREEVRARALQKASLSDSGVGLSIPIGGRVRGGTVTADGTIILASEDPPAILVFTPRLMTGTIEWECVGFPSSVAPIACRHPQSRAGPNPSVPHVKR